MTEQTQSSADIAARALEEAKARLSPDEFRLFVYYFNAQYIVVRMQTAEGFDPSIINLFIGGLVEPLTLLYSHNFSVTDETAAKLKEDARVAVLAAFAAAVVPQEKEGAPVYPGVYGLIIDRARQEGFEVPTLKQLSDVDEFGVNHVDRVVDWDSLYAAERFHFQSALRFIIKRKTVPFKFTKKADA